MLLWVHHKTPGKAWVDLVSTDDSIYVTQFLDTLYHRPDLRIPPTSGITLYQADGETEIKNDDLLSLFFAGNSKENPLVVKSESTQVLPFTSFTPCKNPFYNNICNAVEQDSWLTFQHSMPNSTLNRLFIRDSYHSIASSIKPGFNKAIITGTPGIGKSLFMIYLLYKLVKAKKRVIHTYFPDTTYYDGQGGVFDCSLSLPPFRDRTFWNADLWCLFDVKNKWLQDLHTFPYPLCTFVLSMSPQREIINDFKKPPRPQYFYMPIWTETEMETIAPWFPTAIDWRGRFEVLGGIPRFVLEDTLDEPTKLLEAACKRCKFDHCITEIGLGTNLADAKIIHPLIHMTSAPPFTEPSVAFASQTASSIIVRDKWKEVQFSMEYVFELSEGNSLVGVLRGKYFEVYAIGMLEKGGEFKCRKLVEGEKDANFDGSLDETTLIIEPSVKLVVDKVVPGQTLNQLHVPKSKTNPAIDAWIPGIGAMQITVSETHAIKNSTATIEILAMIGPGAQTLYWLLPPQVYRSFTKKKPFEIDQYAVKIPHLSDISEIIFSKK
jgi:hypothetical protein